MRKSKEDSTAAKQYVQLLSATLIMIGFQFGITTLLTRVMSPESFGTYKLITNTNLLLQSCVTFGIPVTISYLLTNDGNNVKDYVGAGLRAAIVSCLIGVTFCMMLLVIQLNTGLYIVDNIALVMSPLCMIPVLIYYSEYLCIGTNRISLLSKLKVAIEILLVILLLACWAIFERIGLGMVLCIYATANIMVLIYIFKTLGVSLKVYKGIFKKIFDTNKTVGLQTYIGSIFSVVSARIMVVLLDAYITKGEYAIYSLAITISVPLGPLISTLGSVMFRRFNKLERMSKKFILLLVTSVVGTAGVYVVGVNVFTTVLFGEYYRESISYACAIGIGSLLVGLGDVFNRFVMAKGRGKYIRNAAIISGAINIGIAAVLIADMTTVGVTIARVAGNATYLVLIVIAYLRVSRSIKKVEIQE